MKKISKVLSVLLALLMTFTMFTMTSAAADTYSVKYHANGGKGTMPNDTFTVGVEETLAPNTITKTGYLFLGWASTRNATTAEYLDQAKVIDLASAGQTKTLYAVWSANNYTIHFDANGGEGTMEDQVFTYGKAQALTANTFTKDGYTFSGWGLTNKEALPKYTDQQSVRNLTTTRDEVITFYAVWKANPVTITKVEIASEPTKTEYYVGDTFDATGLSVLLTKSNNTVETITTGFTVSTPDMSTAGEKIVTVTYEGISATFTINVVEKPAEPEYNYTFSIVAPANTEVAHGESIVVSAKLEGTYPEGMYVKCTASNNNFIPTLNADGSYTLVADGVGATVFTATLYTADDQVAAQDTIELTALAEVVEPDEPTTEPSEPEEPAGEFDILGLLLKIIEIVMGLLQPVIDFVMGLIAG